MKTTILTRMAGAAAAIALPMIAVAQDYSSIGSSIGDTGNRETLSTPSSSGSSTTSSNGAYSSGGSFSNNNDTATSGASQAGEFSTGVMVKDGAAYVIHRLQNEMSLPDGSKIEPNGTVKNSDGSTKNMNSSQILSIDGRMMQSPLSGTEMSNPASSTTQPSSSFKSDSTTPGWNTGLGPATSLTPSEDNGGIAIPDKGTPFSNSDRSTGTSSSSSSDLSNSPGVSGALDTGTSTTPGLDSDMND